MPELVVAPNQESPLLADSSRLRGVEALRTRRFADAIVAFAETAARFPHSSEAQADLGVALAAASCYKEAGVALMAALRLKPENVTAAKNLARVMLVLGQPDSASALLLSVLRMNPADTEACLYLAGLEEARGNSELATSWYQRLHSQNPSHPEAWKAAAPVCNVCGERGKFTNPTPENIRESLWCSSCNALNRDRFMVFVLSRILGEQGPMRKWAERKDLRILETDGHRGHPTFLKNKYEYINTHFAQNVLAARLDTAAFADLQELHFPSCYFDLVITCDVFEHVRLHRLALHHVYRVLKPGGMCILQVPYCHHQDRTCIRVQPDGDQDVTLLPVQYHGDNSLVYREYGRDFLDELAGLGFNVSYLEGELPGSNVTRQNIIVIERPSPSETSHPFEGLAQAGFTTLFLPAATAGVTRFLQESAPVEENDLAGTGLAYDRSRHHYYFELGHAERITETLRRSTPYLAGVEAALDLGSTGDLPAILQRFYHVQTVVANGLADRTVRFPLAAPAGEHVAPDLAALEIRGWDIEKDRFPFDAAAFDLVTCLEVLEHLKSDPLFAVREVNRVLKPGGRFILTTPNINSLPGLLRGVKGESPALFSTFDADGSGIIHAKEYSVQELRILLEHGGFRVVDLQTFDAYWYDPAILEQALPLRQALAAAGWKPNLAGQVAFVVGEKISEPRAARYVPLYTADLPLSPANEPAPAPAGPPALRNAPGAPRSSDPPEGPAEHETLLSLAAECRKEGRLDDAERLLGTVLNLAPACQPARKGLAQIALDRGNVPDALRLLFAAFRQSPEDVEIMEHLARALVRNGQDVLALQLLMEAVQKTPDHAGILTVLGDIHARNGKTRYAREYLACVLRLSPADDEARRLTAALGAGDDTPACADPVLDLALEAARIPNLLLLRKEFHEDKTVLAALPDFVIADPTSICNATCITCFHSFENLPWQDLPRECFEKLKGLFSTASQINLFGSGEPFVAREFPYYLQETKRLKRPSTSLTISTNGKILREKHIAMLMEPGLTLQVSIDAATPALFNEIRRGIDFEKFMDNLRHFRQRRGDKAYPRLTFSCTFSKRNLAELPGLFALAKELKVDFVGLFNEYPLHPSERPYLLDTTDAAVFERLRPEFERFGIPYGNFLSFLTSPPAQESFPWKESPVPAATI